MNIYLFLIIIVTYLILSMSITQVDWLFPSNVVLVAYFVSACFFISERNSWGDNLSDKTVTLLIIGITTYLLVSLAVSLYFSKKRQISFQEEILVEKTNVSIPDIDNIIIILIILYEVFALVNYYLEVKNNTLAVSSFSTVGEMIGNYRNMTAFNNGYSIGVSSFSSNNYRIMMVLAYIFMDIIVQNMIVKKKNSHIWKLLHWIPIILFFICSLLSGGRNPLIQLVLAFIVMYYIKYRQFNNENNLKIRTIIKIILLIIGVLISFSVFRGIVGRTSTYSVWDYLAIYIGAPLKLFDLFVSGGSISHLYPGQETFANLLMSLGANIPSGANMEFRIFNGWELGNVYTPFRRYYSDFGVWGLVILTAVEALFYTVFYSKVRRKKFVNNSLDFPTLLYSYLAVGPFYFSIVERFYLFLSKDLLIIIVEMYIFCIFLPKLKINK